MGIGISGLLSFQRALTTTSHNIANVNTDGYSRQSVELGTRVPHVTGAGFFGQGVDVFNVERAYDQFLVENLRGNVSSSARMDAYYSLASQVDNLLADEQAGLTPALQDFFDSVQGLADNPNSIAAREVMISAGDSLAERFNILDERLSTLNSRVNRQMEASVVVVNELAQNIADLNLEITKYTGATGHAPNDLLDKRDQMLQQLAEHVPVQTVEETNGAVNVFVGTGQSLVVGTTASKLAVRSSEFPDTPKRIFLDTGGKGIDISNYVTGGTLGGSLEFVDRILEPARAELGRIAVGFAESFNDQHRLGKDLDGQLGSEFFKDLTQSVSIGSIDNATTTDIAFQTDIVDGGIAKLKASDYRLDYDGADYTLVRLSDSTPLSTGNLAAVSLAAENEGFTISVASGATVSAGDSFLLQPASRKSTEINLAIGEPAKVAAASPLIAQEAVDSVTGYPTNAGTGVIRDLKIVADDGALDPPSDIALQLQFDGVNSFALDLSAMPGWSASPDPLSYDPATNAGDSYTVTLTNPGGDTLELGFELDGTPAAGDSFTLGDNLNVSSDNRNALLLGEFSDRKVLIGGTTSFQSAYGRIVSDVGTKTHQAMVGSEAQQTLLRQAQASRDSLSGVNLDEEAADLIKFQQAYQATAQVITTANSLFQTLLGAVQR